MDFQIPVSQQILSTVSKLDEFRGRWSSGHGIPQQRLGRLREAATARSVGASCRLSGIRISDAEVAGLLRGESIPLSDAGTVTAYAAALVHPLPSQSSLLGSGDLRRLHAVVCGANGRNPEPSPWRARSSLRQAFDAEGRATGRVFSTLPPRLIAGHVEDLLTWFEFEMRSGNRHPVLVVGTFVLGLLTASPFERFNGRLARLLIGRLLLRAGYGYMPYASVESQIEDLRDGYQDAFDLAQTRFWNGEGNLEPWLLFLLEVLDRHRERVETKVELERKATDYPPLQRAILETVREHGTVDAALLLEATHANRNTLKDNLRRLVNRGVLEKTGRRRGTRYRLATADRVAPNGS